MPIPLSQLADRLGAEVDGAAFDLMITGVSSIAGARAGCLVFAEEEASFAAALASPAAAVLVGPQMTAAASKPILRTPQPRLAFARAAVLLRGPQPAPSIHPTAVLAPWGSKLAVASRSAPTPRSRREPALAQPPSSAAEP